MLVSPLKVKVGPIEPDVVELLELALELELEGRNRVQGTATCLPELAELELSDVVALVLEAELLPLLDPELFNERMAKSTLPDPGLMTTSWIVPSVSPEEPCTLELFSLLAWIS